MGPPTGAVPPRSLYAHFASRSVAASAGDLEKGLAREMDGNGVLVDGMGRCGGGLNPDVVGMKEHAGFHIDGGLRR